MCAEPAREIEALRTNHRQWRDIILDPDRFPEIKPRHRQAPARWGDWGRYPLGSVGDTLDLVCVIEPGDADVVLVSIRGVNVMYDVLKKRISIEGGQARLAPSASAPLEPTDGIIRLRVLVDRTTCEVFAADTRIVLPLGVIPVDDNYSLAVAAKGGRARIISLDCWQLNSIWSPTG